MFGKFTGLEPATLLRMYLLFRFFEALQKM